MKKIIAVLGIFITGIVYGQDLDTVIIRSNLTLQAQDWCWLRGKLGASQDSALLANDRRMNALVAPQLPLAWTANVTFDSLPGRLVFAFYQAVKTANAGEIVSRYTAIVSALTAKTELSYWYGFFDANLTRDYEASRNSGKNVYVDQ
jgi:hypothetical protein